jgi:hypothetical protein
MVPEALTLFMYSSICSSPRIHGELSWAHFLPYYVFKIPRNFSVLSLIRLSVFMIFTTLKNLSVKTFEKGRETTNITANFRYAYTSVPEIFLRKNQTPVGNRIHNFNNDENLLPTLLFDFVSIP